MKRGSGWFLAVVLAAFVVAGGVLYWVAIGLVPRAQQVIP